MPHIRPFAGTHPTLGQRCWIDPGAHLVGDVVLGDDVSLWPGTVVRGDVNSIRIGDRTNIQDGAVVHVTHDGPHGPPGGVPTLIGADVTIGHGAIVHACTIEDAVLVGMGAIVLDGAVIRREAFVGAGELWVGNPARCVRRLSPEEIARLYYSAEHYVRLKDRYLADPAQFAAAGA